jgi:hypothetical protein
MQPKEVVENFIKAMNKWEIHAAKSKVPDWPTMKVELQKVFDEFCTKKERKTGRLENLTYSSPPEYDPKNQIVTEIIQEKSNKVFIYTEMTSEILGDYQYCYVVFKKDDKWLIDSKKSRFHLDEKWENSSL